MIERDYHYTFYADDLPNAYQFKEANAVNIKYENDSKMNANSFEKIWPINMKKFFGNV